MMWTRCNDFSFRKGIEHIKQPTFVLLHLPNRNISSIRFVQLPYSNVQTKNNILFSNQIHVSKWNKNHVGIVNFVRNYQPLFRHGQTLRGKFIKKPGPVLRYNPREGSDPADVIVDGKKREPLLPPGIANLNPYSNRGLYFLITPLTTVIGIFLIVFGIFSIYTGMESYLWKKGEGTILTCNYIKVGGFALVNLKYEYRDHKNERRIGRRIRTGTPFAFIEPFRKPELLTPGKPIQVLYDESHPTRATLLPGTSNTFNCLCIAAGTFALFFL